MMQITAIPEFNPETGEWVKKWTMMELQGSLKVDGNISLAGKLIGDLAYTKDGGAVLVIGHHVMTGKLVKLDKPLAVLQRSGESASNYDVPAIITHKLIFKTRPRPIVNVDP